MKNREIPAGYLSPSPSSPPARGGEIIVFTKPSILLPINLLQGFLDLKYNAANQTGSVGLTFQRMQICGKEGSEQRKGSNFLFAEDRRWMALIIDSIYPG
jgi:hypothetical protein